MCPSVLLRPVLVRRSFLSELLSSWVTLNKGNEAGAAQLQPDSLRLFLTSVANRDHLLQHLLSPVILQGFHYDVVGGPSGKTLECGTGGSARNPELQRETMPGHQKGRWEYPLGVTSHRKRQGV